jgi:hypothetical protein
MLYNFFVIECNCVILSQILLHTQEICLQVLQMLK